MPSKKIIGVKVFLEGRSHRRYVGLLSKKGDQFCFEYEKKYLNDRRIIPLGPEMPLNRPVYYSPSLFVPFLDRLPLRENPAYEDYCRATRISVDETDPFILLTTIGHRGPSSFIFEPDFAEDFTSKDLLNFRQSLGLSVKEFASIFEFSPAAITRIELSQSSGREILKRAEIYARFPEASLKQLRFRGGVLHPKKYKQVVSKFLPQTAFPAA